MIREREVRVLSFRPELREASAEGELPTVEGYAAVFNSLSENLGGFRERIVPGAFKRALSAKSLDCRALINHDPNLVLGRSTASTLRLAEDAQGLKVSISPAGTTYARDLIESLKRGDVDQMSFAFIIADEGDSYSRDAEGRVIRDVTDIEELLDVSIVTYPAYPATQAKVSQRSIDKATELATPAAETEEQRQAGALARARALFGVDLREASFQDRIDAAWNALYALLGSPWASDSDVYGWWIVAMFEDRVVIQTGPGRYVQYSVTFDARNVATLADPTPVEVQYVAVATEGQRSGDYVGVPNEVNEARLRLSVA